MLLDFHRRGTRNFRNLFEKLLIVLHFFNLVKFSCMSVLCAMKVRENAFSYLVPRKRRGVEFGATASPAFSRRVDAA